MNNIGTKNRIRLISLILFLTVTTLWALFYFIISDYISDNTKMQMALAADQIIERLGGEFSLAGKLSYSLTNNNDVKALSAEKDPDEFFKLTEKINSSMNISAFNLDFTGNIIIYGADLHYYRLTGKLGNTACARLANIISSYSLPTHLAVTLDQQNYIGYADKISFNETEGSGAAAILIAEEKILEIMRAYDQAGSLLVAIMVNGEVVTANTDKINLFTSNGSKRPVIHSRLGITPYEILVAADARYLNASRIYFTIVALITAAIFAAVTFLYGGILSRRFFRPMVKVIGSIENLNADAGTETLPYVQSEEFDGLIDKINELLKNLENKNLEVKNGELRIKNAEIEKQKALVFSLKKQINAHFTINTLNAVRILIESGELEKAKAIAEGLTSLIRYAHADDEKVNIWDELDILEKYVYIMNIRYNGKLAADFDFDDRLMDNCMPRMLLQPIMENSIVHGFNGMESGCVISVKAILQGGVIAFSISDNGRGMSGEELKALNAKLDIAPEMARGFENIALLNIKNRLNYYYGNAGRLNVQPNDGRGIEVRITIPFISPKGGLV